MEPREEFLVLAFEVAVQGVESGAGGPFGAVVVRGDDVLASAHNQVVTTNDPTAHAEIGAIRAACLTLGSFQLDERRRLVVQALVGARVVAVHVGH